MTDEKKRILVWCLAKRTGPIVNFGYPNLGPKYCPELTDHGLVPLRCGCAREPKPPGEARTAHPPASRRQDSSICYDLINLFVVYMHKAFTNVFYFPKRRILRVCANLAYVGALTV